MAAKKKTTEPVVIEPVIEEQANIEEIEDVVEQDTETEVILETPDVIVVAPIEVKVTAPIEPKTDDTFPGQLRIGHTGEGVRRLQELLCANGYPTVVDGEFTAETSSVLIDYNRDHVLGTRMNILTEITWKQLTKA
jgi:peptidoglycan hydrolase-like protein with peptidoglycan-binding domain